MKKPDSAICRIEKSNRSTLKEVQNNANSGPAIPRGRREATRNKMKSVIAKNRLFRKNSSNSVDLSVAEEKHEAPFLRSKAQNSRALSDENYVVNIHKLNASLQSCQYCRKGPLSLAELIKSPKQEGLGVVLSIKCLSCKKINIIRPQDTHRNGTRGPPVFDTNTRSGLAIVHSGIGHSHLAGALSVLGLSAPSVATLKKREREAGLATESVARESCMRHRQFERKAALDAGSKEDGEGCVSISTSYDGAWSKRCRSMDSHTGFGSVIGSKTKKIVSYGTRSTICRTCSIAERNQQDPKHHDCRKDHTGPAKSTEAEIAVELFSEAPKYGMKYATYTGDDDSTTEKHIECRVPYEVTKWSDIQHARRNFGSRLYNARSSVKGLSARVIQYFSRCFMYCLYQHENNPEGLRKGLSVIVPHAFGDHSNCLDWCGYKKDPTNYTHKDLPGGKDLAGDDLKAAIKDCIEPFTTTESTRKLAHLGSSQSNESFNSVVGSKAPKIRHYGSSESQDFRVASSVNQFNEGYSYLNKVTEVLDLGDSPAMGKYTESVERKRKGEKIRRKSRKAKRRRADIKKSKLRKTEKKEKKEGTTYQSRVALMQPETCISSAMIQDVKSTVKETEVLEMEAMSVSAECMPKELTDNTRGKDDQAIFVLDLETTGFHRNSDIIQLACTSHDQTISLNKFCMPTREIQKSASRVTGIVTGYRNGKKVLLKHGEELPAESTEDILKEFLSILRVVNDNGKSPVLIAHNGFSFDFPVLLHSLNLHKLLDDFHSLDVLLVDSLKLIRELSKSENSALKNCKKHDMSSLYRYLFSDELHAHDAAQDTEGLLRILLHLDISPSTILLYSKESKLFFIEVLRRDKAKAYEQEYNNVAGLTTGMKKKLIEVGIRYLSLKDVFEKKGVRGIIIILALPTVYTAIAEIKNGNPELRNTLKLSAKLYSISKTK